MRTESRQSGAYCLFDTRIGPCGIAWSDRGVTRLRLPDSDPDGTARRLGVDGPAASPPESISRVIADVQRFLDGSRVDFAAAPLDLAAVTPFRRAVYDAARRLGWGRTASYGELARLAGSPGAARAVGGALACNPIAIIIPCHRILASGNKLGGFTAYGGTSIKELLLSLEGIQVSRP